MSAAIVSSSPHSNADIRIANSKRAARRRWLLLAPALTLLFVASAGPLLLPLVFTFLEKGDYAGVKWVLSGEAWFSVLFQRDIFEGTVSLNTATLSILWRSIFLALVATVLSLIIGFPTAYFIATRSPRWRSILLFLITLPFWTNGLIRTFAIMEYLRQDGVINTALLWIGIISQPIQMLNTDFAVGVGLAYVFLPLMVLPLYASIEKLDFRLVEAGFDLYARWPQVLKRIILPAVRPGLVAGCLLVFIPALGSYVTARFMGGGRSLMIGNLIEHQFQQGRNWPLGSALSMCLMAFVVIGLMINARFSAKSGASS